MADIETLLSGAELFDDRPQAAAASRFLDSPDHHLLFAWDDTDQPVGFISGVELTHPDKGSEMYVNELGVAEAARRQGVATLLVEALAALAKDAGCYGMWEVSETENTAALATYRRAAAAEQTSATVFSWRF